MAPSQTTLELTSERMDRRCQRWRWRRRRWWPEVVEKQVEGRRADSERACLIGHRSSTRNRFTRSVFAMKTQPTPRMNNKEIR